MINQIVQKLLEVQKRTRRELQRNSKIFLVKQLTNLVFKLDLQ